MKVLLVEDNSDDAEFLRLSLRQANARSIDITRAAQLGDAVVALRGTKFDVVLLDLHLPDASGAECVERLQGADPLAPIVVLSGRGDEDFAVDILNRGVQDYLVKWEGDGRIILRSIRYAIERKRADVKLNYLARYDPLTGIPNRQYLREQLERATAGALNARQKVALLLLDLDRFKVVNDSLGHQVGDELLRAVVQRLRDNLREGHNIARLGGDEFALLIEDFETTEELEAMATEIVRRFEAPFVVGERQLSVTASIGITVYPVDNADPVALLNNADIAMYRAKEQGRNSFEFFTPSMHEQVVSYHRLETELKAAITEQQFELVYQPQFGLTDHRIHAVEALLRWNHPVRGQVRPEEFVSVAEDRGYIIPVGLWAIEQVCRQLKQWESMGAPLPRVAINIAAAQFRQADFPMEVRHALDRYGIASDLIELELTERSLMEDTDATRECLRRLKDIGVRLAIDDFGTGYSCLSYLRRFPLDVLKIDRSFVSDLHTSGDAQAICGAILSIAHRLSLDAVAEGIETEQQLAFLTRHGCQFGQGYYFSRPVDAAAIGALIADRAAQTIRERGVEQEHFVATAG
jgi:diguanylate cyclase (GGDEF)-like protein